MVRARVSFRARITKRAKLVLRYNVAKLSLLPVRNMTLKQTSTPAQELSPGIDRRSFLKAGSVATLGLFFRHESVWACDTSMAFLLQELPEGERMRKPDQVGVLRPRDFRELWSIFSYIGRKWEDG